jgi:hypothetical protein
MTNIAIGNNPRRPNLIDEEWLQLREKAKVSIS